MTTPLNRRRFLKQSLVTCAAATAAAQMFPVQAAEENNRYTGLNSGDYLGEVKIEATVEDQKIFTEGPAVDGRGVVFFTNVPVSKILKFDPKTKKLSVFRNQTNETNGLLFDPDGNLLACEGGAGRVVRIQMKTGKVEVLADKYRNFPLAAPNDLALDSQGRIYFSSRPGVTDPKEGNVNAVYRIDPEGQLVQLLALPDVHMPNGLVTSPDDKVFYLIESDGGKDRNRHIKRYDLQADGTLGNPRILYNFSPGRSGDGMCIDEQGNLYVAAGLHQTRGSSETLDTRPGIHVISPEGKLLAYAETPIDTVTNCTFGGEDLKTLYITCGKYLLSLRTRIPGKPAYRPKG